MRLARLFVPLCLGFMASFAACDDNDVGAPCTEDADCAEGLICDEHDGQSSCQEEHGHETGHETEHGDHGSGTHETGTAEHGSGSGDHATGDHDTGSGEHGSSTGEHGTSGG